MKTLLPRSSQESPTIAVFGVAATVVLAGNTKPAQPSGVHITPLSPRNHRRKWSVPTAPASRSRREARATCWSPRSPSTPARSFGWHTHLGPVLVAVGDGHACRLRAHGRTACSSTVNAGQAFVEDGGHVHSGPKRDRGPGGAERDLPRPHGHHRIPQRGATAAGGSHA